MPTSLAMVAAGKHTPRDRARGIGVWAAALATGSFVSPVLGGLLAQIPFGSGEYASWRWAFLALAGLALVSALVTLALATNSSSAQGRSLDWPGQITVAVALFALLFGVIQGAEDGWGSAKVIGSFVISVVFFVVFVLVERRTEQPLLQLLRVDPPVDRRYAQARGD